jgi:hypothetical protein
MLITLMSSAVLQVQNLNNIMAFPLENVLKTETREGRLVRASCYHALTYTDLLLARPLMSVKGAKWENTLVCTQWII